MDLEIEEKLELIYNIPVKVYKRYLEFRVYDIIITINKKEIELTVIYDNSYTLDANISEIIKKIDNMIVKEFKK